MTTEEKARAYAEKRLANDLGGKALTCDKSELLFNAYDMKQAYEDGATEALASQWKDPKVEPPEDDETVFVSDENGFHIATYFDGEWYSSDDEFTRNPQMWLPIPPLKGGEA